MKVLKKITMVMTSFLFFQCGYYKHNNQNSLNIEKQSINLYYRNYQGKNGEKLSFSLPKSFRNIDTTNIMVKSINAYKDSLSNRKLVVIADFVTVRNPQKSSIAFWLANDSIRIKYDGYKIVKSKVVLSGKRRGICWFYTNNDDKNPYSFISARYESPTPPQYRIQIDFITRNIDDFQKEEILDIFNNLNFQ